MATPATGPANQPTINFGPGYSAPDSLEGVGFGLRLVARLIDYGVIYFAILVPSFFFGFVLGIIAAIRKQPLPSDLGTITWQPLVAGILAFFLYHWICEGLHGSTLGKLLLGLVVISEDGKPCGLKAAAGRSLAYFLDSMFFGIVAYLSMKDSPKQQRLGDKWNDTMVVRRVDVAPQNLRSGGRFFMVFVLAGVVVVLNQVFFLILKFAF